LRIGLIRWCQGLIEVLAKGAGMYDRPASLVE
jgi:hypothetical protein